MALQSSGQISLSQIAAEFGGSAPHALSEYYGDGNAPASGEIQLAADFYGTSNNISFTTTLNWGTVFLKSGNESLGYWNSSSAYSGATINGGPHPTTLGSLNSQLSGNNILSCWREMVGISADSLFLEFANTGTTNWSTLTIGSKTVNRTSATNTNNKIFEWANVSATDGAAGNFMREDSNTAIVEDPFGTGTHASGTPSGSVTITIA